MANPLYQQYGRPVNPQMAQMKNAFNDFRKKVNGNPQQIIMQALQEGRITQEQLNHAQESARQMGWLWNN
jgi:hypothetical protein